MQYVMTYELTDRNKLVVWSYYRKKKDDNIIKHLLRHSQPPMKTKKINEIDILQNRMNLEGQRLKIAAIPFVPLLAIDYDEKDQARGFHKALFDTLASHLNFTYDIIIPDDQKFGGLQANGNWSGIVGMCLRGQVDFGMPIRRTPLREKYIRSVFNATICN